MSTARLSRAFSTQNGCVASPMELELPPDFKELFRSLNANGVKYLLIGGYAVILHGYVRNTSDLDIVVSDDPMNALKCVKAITDFGFDGADLNKELFSSPDSLVRMGVEPIKIEILNYLNGVDFDQAYERRVNIQVEDIELSVICLDDLLVNKKSVGRLKDLLDVEELERQLQESPILPTQV